MNDLEDLINPELFDIVDELEDERTHFHQRQSCWSYSLRYEWQIHWICYIER